MDTQKYQLNVRVIFLCRSIFGLYFETDNHTENCQNVEAENEIHGIAESTVTSSLDINM